MSTAAARSTSSTVARFGSKAVELTPTINQSQNDRLRTQYLNGLPRTAYNFIKTAKGLNPHPQPKPPVESHLSPSLDDRISAANHALEGALGKKAKAPRDQSTITMVNRGQHVPIGLIARELKGRFWHRLYKRLEDKKEGEEGEEGEKK